MKSPFFLGVSVHNTWEHSNICFVCLFPFLFWIGWSWHPIPNYSLDWTLPVKITLWKKGELFSCSLESLKICEISLGGQQERWVKYRRILEKKTGGLTGMSIKTGKWPSPGELRPRGALTLTIMPHPHYCSKCSGRRFTSTKLIQHIGLHAHEACVTITCEINDCQSIFTKYDPHYRTIMQMEMEIIMR